MAKTSLKHLFIWLFIYAAGMAYLESTIVVYLRALYYPGGFSVEMAGIPFEMLKIEIFREAATMVMLLAVAVISGETRFQRMGVFLFCFGVWDIFYYIWLRILIGWPAGLLDWDVLFLIPSLWLGPVAAPVLVSIGLCGTGLIFYRYDLPPCHIRSGILPWILILTGCALILLSFMLPGTGLAPHAEDLRYPWWLFFTGAIPACAGVLMIFNRSAAANRSR